jgi:hypothetical protein
VMFPIISARIAQYNPMIFFTTAGVFSSRTDLTGIITHGTFVIGIDRTWEMVFCPVQTAGIAVISATFVGAPVGCFSCTAVFAELGACQEWI